MELIVIGSGTAALEVNHGPSAYILNFGDEVFLLDGGTGTLRKCLEAGVSYRDIDRIFYSHFHPDHTIDLIPFLFATKYTPGFHRVKPLRMYGPVGFESFFDRLVELYGRGMVEVEYELMRRELSVSEIALDGGSVVSRRVKHSEGAIGYRFEQAGRVFTYSGDTDMCEGIVELARGAHLLLIECSFPDKRKIEGHLTPSEVGRIAAEAGPERIVLTHIYPPYEEEEILSPIKQYFDGDVQIAHDLLRLSV